MRTPTPCRFCGVAKPKDRAAGRCVACGRYQRSYLPNGRTTPRSQNSADIVAYRQANPCLTLESIGLRFGITRERVRQVLARSGAPTKHRIIRPTYECQTCHAPFMLTWSQQNQTKTKPMFCPSCRNDAAYMTLPCTNCGAPKQVSAAEYVWKIDHPKATNLGVGYTGRVFCNSHCFGVWAGKNFGGNRHARRQKAGEDGISHEQVSTSSS